MVHEFRANIAYQAYRPMLNYVEKMGEYEEVRGQLTKEILNSTLEILQPRKRCILVPGRRWNPWIGLSEGLWIITGSNTFGELLPFNSRIQEYSDDNETLHGAYGYRLRDSIEQTLINLKEDPQTRRAVMPIFWPSDVFAKSKDIPCNTSIMLKLRDNKLHMTINNRSNDLHWGLFAANIPQFSIFLEAMAMVLDVKVGTQTHLSNSLHIYKNEIAQGITDSMFANIGSGLPDYPNDIMPMNEGIRADESIKWSEIVEWAEGALWNETCDFGKDPPWFESAREFLNVYRLPKKETKKAALEEFKKRHAGWDDWILAGEMFLNA